MNENVCPTLNRHIAWFIPFRTDISVRGDTSWHTYTPVFPIFYNNKNILFTAYHFFCAIVLQVEFVGVLRSVPLRRNEIRSILRDDYPLSSVQLRGQIRLKDTTSFRWARICFLLSKCLFALQVCFLHNFVSGFLHEKLNNILKTNLLFCSLLWK